MDHPADRTQNVSASTGRGPGKRIRCRPGVSGMAAVLAILLYGLALLDARFPPPLDRAGETSVEVVAADGRLLRAFTTAAGRWRLAGRAAEVDAGFLALLLAVEDSRFYWHPGVDPLAAARAAWQWAATGQVVSGASTLTMQVARLLEPELQPPPDSPLAARLVGKARQAARALQLDLRLSKPQILDLYLTLAPYGGNLEGLRAATRAYFGRPPDALSPAEAALLVALPQAPEALRPDRHPGRARAARNRILERAAAFGLLSRSAAREAAADPLPQARFSAPFAAPHLARRLVTEDPSRRLHRTWIDADLQARLQRLADTARSGLEAGSSVAILAVEDRPVARLAARRTVRAYVGAADFFDARSDGQVDMIPAVRSPGSALKPILYALAFDLGIAHPETVAIDAPSRFGRYRPTNFDHHYRGAIALRAALQLSLNVPAVQLLERIGPARFASRLEAVGAPLRFDGPDTRPSLAVALGGAGISLESLVILYAALADGGWVRPLAYRQDQPQRRGVRLVGPVAAWQVAEILADAPPPPGWMGARNDSDNRRIAIKTGTSYGYRDAWAVGTDGVYTIGVWVGRPDGRYGQTRSGRTDAAPILRRAFDRLPPVGSRVAAGPGGPMPDGVLLATGDALPMPLRRLTGDWESDPVGAARTAPATGDTGLAIDFPPDGATLSLGPEASGGRLSLRATGGRLPLRWLVDGRPIESLPFRRSADWTPHGRGRVRITVIDRDGRTSSSAVWLE